MKTTKINFFLIHKIVYWIVLIWYSKVPNSIDHASTWINQVEKWTKENGPIHTIAYIKMIKQIVISYLSDKPQLEVKMIIGINRSNGLPKQITYLHKLIESRDPKALRFVFTLLSISRVIPGWKDPDLSTLVDPCQADELYIKSLSSSMGAFLKDYQFDFKLVEFRKEHLHFSNKAGPSGRATKESLIDLCFMPNNLKELLMRTNIRPIMIHYAEIFKSNLVERFYLVQKNYRKIRQLQVGSVQTVIDLFAKHQITDLPKPEYRMRKLSIVQDPEAKSRIIAILDYWSQTWLKQIHSIHFNFLRRIPQDRTFTQDPIIPNKPLGHKIYSFDLTAATDRFPIALQKRMIEEMFGSETADLWEGILIDTPFYVPWEQTTIKYNCGQPMGAYSSWSTFTITHHYILWLIHKNLGLKDKFYLILGDDIVIYHDAVADEYQNIMKNLSVGISIPKSCISSKMYEFAKRIFINGVEVTGIQIKGFYNNINKYHLIYQSVYELIYSRHYIPDGFVQIPHLVSKLYQVCGRKVRETQNIKSRVDLLHSFHRFLDGYKDPLENYLVRMFHNYPHQLHFHDVVNLNNYVYTSIYNEIESKQSQYISYAEDFIKNPLVNEMAGLGLADAADILTSPQWLLIQHPLTQAVANVIESLSRARKLDSFKDMIEVLALPSPQLFTERASTRLIGAKAKLAKRFLAEFESQVIQGRLIVPPMAPLGNSVLMKASSDIESMIRSTDRHTGLIPGLVNPEPLKMTFSSNINDYI